MTPLRLRMIEDMRTAGLASGTQALYLDAVRNLAAHYRRPPDGLSEEEVRAYLLSLRERGVALGTFKTNHGGIQFLYRWTLDRDWPLFGKKKDPSAKAAAPTVGSARSRDPCAFGLRQKPRSQDLPCRHVWLWSTHKRGRDPGSWRNRQRQYAAAYHRQGQQAAACTVATASSERSA
jgi:Phage integrase, N-terminal SAM-like domain